MVPVDEALVAEVAKLGSLRAPAEACGLAIDSLGSGPAMVVELENRSPQPTDSYVLTVDQIAEALENMDLTEVPAGRLLVWHTHPQGNVGPSGGDMRSRLPGMQYLVVSLGPEPVAVTF